MCAIIDANVAFEVFGESRPPAGELFMNWLSGAKGQLVVGGKLRAELSRDRRFLQWFRSAVRYGRTRLVNDVEVDGRTKEIHRAGICKSDDEHVLALALVSGARLLYTNDLSLIDDFGNREIIAKPRGKVYTTAKSGQITDAHRNLLAARDLCRVARR